MLILIIKSVSLKCWLDYNNEKQIMDVKVEYAENQQVIRHW